MKRKTLNQIPKHVRRKAGSLRFSQLTARQKASLEKSLALLSDLRRGKGSYSELLRKHHLHTRTVHRYLGDDLHGGTHGQRVRPSKSDKRMRDLLFPEAAGDVRRPIRGSQAASKLSEFFNDREKLLRNEMSAEKFEAKWRGVRIAGQEVFADAAAIFIMANADDLKVENLYSGGGGSE
jgi:hypothetical protein